MVFILQKIIQGNIQGIAYGNKQSKGYFYFVCFYIADMADIDTGKCCNVFLRKMFCNSDLSDPLPDAGKIQFLHNRTTRSFFCIVIIVLLQYNNVKL